MIRAVDLFAGAGGWSEGATAAGVRVAAAVNHWPLAVASHTANHPETLHVCQDAALMDPRKLPEHDLLLASPACQGHSNARGTDKPHHDACRATAWCVINVLEVCRPRWVAIENVPEFRRWPLYLYWRLSLEALGYHLDERVFCASEFGVPQNRKRLFILGELGRAPSIYSPALPARSASSFLSLTSDRWSPIRTPKRAAATLARIENGRRQHGKRFLLPYYGSSTGGRCLSRPIGTITTFPHYALIDEDRMRMLSIDELKHAMGFRPDYVLTGNCNEQIKQLGNAVCPPVAESLVRQLVGA